MSAIILFDYWRSTAAYRVRVALHLKRVAFTTRIVDLLDGAHKQADYMADNPMGLVPTLLVDGQPLTQSLAIIDWLDNVYPEPRLLLIEPFARARTLAQALIVAADIHPINNMAVGNYLKSDFGADQDGVVQWMHHWMRRGFDALEAQAPAAGLFGGDAPNLADICLAGQMVNARRFDLPMAAYPRLLRIDTACNALAAFQAAAPERVPQG